VTVSEKEMNGRKYDQCLNLEELEALEGFLERACNEHDRPRYP
jgi:hypothetical protein